MTKNRYQYQVGVDGIMVGPFHESFVSALDWARERFERFTIAKWNFGTIYHDKGDHEEKKP